MDKWVLSVEASKYLQLRQHLLADYPGADEETVVDTLEGITNLHEMIAAIIRSALVDEALHAGLRSRLDDMRQRLSRLEERCVKKRMLAGEAMNEVGLKKLEQADFTASTRPGSPSLVVTSEQAIPKAYWVPQPPKLDRQGLAADLKRAKISPARASATQISFLL
jgi:Siphovirus Gp157